MAQRAGQHDRRIKIQQRTQTRDAAGQPQDTWVDHASRWAKVTHVGGGESFGDQQREAKASVTFETRGYINGLSAADCRVEYEGEIYDIERIDEVGRRAGQVFFAYTYDGETGS